MPATIGYVQALGTANNSGTTLAITLGAGVNASLAGNALVLWIAWASTTATLTAVTDTKGNTWTVEPAATGTAQRAALAVCLNPARLVEGDQVTATLSASLNKIGSLHEFAGIKVTGTPRDGTVAASGAGTSGTSQAVASGALVTANAADVLLGVVEANTAGGDTLTAAGYTGLAKFAGSGMALYPVYRVVAATGSYDLAGTLTGGGTLTRAWIAAQWGFRASDVSAPQAAFVGVEVALVVGTGRSAAFVAAEAALGTAHAAVAFVAAEVAGTFPAPPPSTAVRTATGNEVRFPW